MGLFNQFPFTNFHEMNLDWVINEIKKLDASNEYINENIEKLVLDNIDKIAGIVSIQSVKSYGAIGNGLADDTEAFSKALNDNDILYIPTGNYYLTNLNLKGKTLIGANSFRNYNTRNSKSSCIVISGDVVIENTFLFNMEFKSSDTEYDISDKFFIKDPGKTVNSLFMNCAFYGYKGVSNYNFLLGISDCLISQCDYGIYGMIDSFINGSYIYTCNTGILLGNGCNANRISDSKIEWCGSYGINMEHAINNQITNCMIDRTEGTGLRLFETKGNNIDIIINRSKNYNFSLNNIDNEFLKIISNTGNSADEGTGATWPIEYHSFINGGKNCNIDIIFSDDGISVANVSKLITHGNFKSNRNIFGLSNRNGVYITPWVKEIDISISMEQSGYNAVQVTDLARNLSGVLYIGTGTPTVILSTLPESTTFTYNDGILHFVGDIASFYHFKYY